MERGVKQGDALSCALFILAIDPVIRNIYQNAEIKPLEIEIGNNDSVTIKTLAYADDISIICENDDSIKIIFLEYERLSKFSGLVLNADKTEIFNMSLLSNQTCIENNIVYLGESYHIGRKDNIKVCGMTMCLDKDREYKFNITDKIDKLVANLKIWSKRNLTMNGRMIIAKTYGLSQLTFAFQYYYIEPKDLSKIEKYIYSYVNTNKAKIMPERISRKYLKNQKSKGGINGIDVEAFHFAITHRQFSKSIKHSIILKNLINVLSEYDYISKICQKRSNLVWRKHTSTPNEIEELRLLSGTHIGSILKEGSKAHKITLELGLKTAGDIQKSINDTRTSRRNKNIIMKSLPTSYRTIINNNLLMDSDVNVCLPLEGQPQSK